MGRMLDHLGIQCADVATAAAFYDSVFVPLGFRRVMDFGEYIGYGADQKPDFWLGPNTGSGFRESHIAFEAPDRAAVRAFFRRGGAGRRRSAARAQGLARVPPRPTTEPSCAIPTATTSKPSATLRSNPQPT
jgi:catechol 2,3-dioxygenase-like lactoylglutathione lyase family enzyme